MTQLEHRLRHHFMGDGFRPSPGWEARLLGELPARAGPVRRLRRPGPGSTRFIAPRALAAAALVLLALLAVITATPALAASGAPAWVTGLRSAVHIDTTGEGRASSWGYTLELVGVFADDQRTIVVLKGTHDGSVPSLYRGSLTTAGHRIEMRQSVTSDDGYYSVGFAPLAVPRSVPVPVTLQLAGGFLPPRSWTLTFAIAPDRARSLVAPEPGQAGRPTITFSGVQAAPGALAIDWTETGASYQELFSPPVAPVSDLGGGLQMRGPRQLLMHMQVFDATGKPLRWLDTQIDPSARGDTVRFSQVSLRTGPSPYRVVITAPDGGTLERTIRS